jgi:hypothetical protein
MSIGALSASYATQSPVSNQPTVQVASSLTQTNTQADTQPAAASSTTQLSDEALAMIDNLKARDTEVRQHEQAHLAASGGLASSGATYTYERGPDGVNYAIGGEVNIDTSPGGTPQETIERARTIQAAALAPADPSGQDRAVAAQAQQMGAKARADLAQQQTQSAYGATSAAAPTLDVYA